MHEKKIVARSLLHLKIGHDEHRAPVWARPYRKNSPPLEFPSIDKESLSRSAARKGGACLDRRSNTVHER
jgi:hypothetical protein